MASATWMITLDLGGPIAEAGACEEHIAQARLMPNFVTAEPWVTSGDNPLQAKLRLQLMAISDGLNQDLLDEATRAIDKQDYEALDEVLERIEQVKFLDWMFDMNGGLRG
jgi:hypothetical protein